MAIVNCSNCTKTFSLEKVLKSLSLEAYFTLKKANFLGFSVNDLKIGKGKKGDDIKIPCPHCGYNANQSK